MRKTITAMIFLLAFSASAMAASAKWETMKIDDVSAGLEALSKYCLTHDVKLEDVLWANQTDEASLKSGMTLLLPKNQADMLAIWQHAGAWKPTALVPVTSKAAADRAVSGGKTETKHAPVSLSAVAKAEAKKKTETPKVTPISQKGELFADSKPVEAPKAPAKPAETPTPEVKAEPAAKAPVKQESPAKVIAQLASKKSDIQDDMKKLEEEVKAAKSAETKVAETPTPEVKAEPAAKAPVKQESPAKVIAQLASEKTDLQDEMRKLKEEVKSSKPAQTLAVKPAPVVQTPVKPAQTLTASKKKESPAKIIKQTAKPDKILTAKKKSSQQEIPGLMDPIIILSPNGDPTSGPMRLIISGDKVEVVKLPQNAVPKKPSVADANAPFTSSYSYLPYYNVGKSRGNIMTNLNNFNNFNSLGGKMMWPVDGKISSPFGKWRGNHRHQGIDIPMPTGTPIRAARNGVVTRTGNNSTMGFRGYGNFVLLDHGGGVQSFYAHCNSVAVQQGQRIMQGQIIGYVGSTGRSSGSHLHFEVRINNVKVNPVPYLAGNTHYASK